MKKSTLKKYRENLGVSSTEASKVCGMPLRTYQRYEQNDSYGNKLKRKAIFDILKDKYEITEEKGILKFENIKTKVNEVLDKYKDKHSNITWKQTIGFRNKIVHDNGKTDYSVVYEIISSDI